MFPNYVPPALFVTWRDPDTRTVYPVGRLVRTAGPQPGYEFAYLKGAAEAAAHGFAPFLAFPELPEIYRSAELPPFFQNRLMPPARAEYAGQLTDIGLDAAASAEQILARTNGLRATDPYEVFGEFEPGDAADVWESRFFVRSLRYLDFPQAIDALTPGDRLLCALDVQNPADSDAVCLRTKGNALVGFCPAYLLDDLRPLLLNRGDVTVTVARLNPPPTPLQHRLQCFLSIHTPHEFHAYRRGRFEPLCAEAIRLAPWTPAAKVA